MILFPWILANTLLIGGLYLLTYAFYKLLQPVPKANFAEVFVSHKLPFVSVVVPARNEEDKIGRCLNSLLAQDYPNFEIIVIDDRSTDNTAQVIQACIDEDVNQRLKFVHGKDAPEGWIGKCNALAHAVSYASGDWFVFTDADTYHKPNSISDAVSYAQGQPADLVSFVPMQELASFPEKLIMPVLLSSFLLGDPFHSVNDEQAERAYAYGQYIVCRRSAYLAVGGHKGVRDEIVEDHALAGVLKKNGYKICVADGRTLYKVRMYTNLETLWQGWTKNLYSLIDSRIANLLIILLLINTTVLIPFVQFFIAGYMFVKGIEPIIVSNSALLLLAAVQLAVLFCWYKQTSKHHVGTNWRHFLLMPFGSLTVTVLYFHAAYLVLSGSQVNWKGRRYVVNKAKTIRTLSRPLAEPVLNQYRETPVSVEAREISTIV